MKVYLVYSLTGDLLHKVRACHYKDLLTWFRVTGRNVALYNITLG